MEPAHDVELARRHAARLLRLVVDLLQRPGVRALLLRHAGERAEHAGVPKHADVRRVDVLIGGEEHAIAVPPGVGDLGQAAQAEQVGRRIEAKTVGGVQPDAGEHFLGDGWRSGSLSWKAAIAVGHAISLGERG